MNHENYLSKLLELSKDNKYQKIYTNIILNAKKRATSRRTALKIFDYVESHHILPKSFDLGGAKDNENLVYLTPKEHFIVHCVLTKMLSGKYKMKMLYSLQRLKTSNKNQKLRYFNSNLYSQLKRNMPKYTRLYKLDSVKYVIDKEDIDLLVNDGWSKIMTAEFKIGRVGHMKGRKHSEQSKKLMRENSARYWTNKTMSEESNMKKSKRLTGIKRTETFKENQSKNARRQHADGRLNSKGNNNPNSKFRKNS